jgi:hypothetical protein
MGGGAVSAPQGDLFGGSPPPMEVAPLSLAQAVAQIRAAVASAPPDISTWAAVERSAARDMGALIEAAVAQWWDQTLGPPARMPLAGRGDWARVEEEAVAQACAARGVRPRHAQVCDDGEHVVIYASTRGVRTYTDDGAQIWVAREIDRAAWLDANARLREGAPLAIGGVEALRRISARPWHERRVEDYAAWAEGLAPILEPAAVFLRSADTWGILELARNDRRRDRPAPVWRVTSIDGHVSGAAVSLWRALAPRALPWLAEEGAEMRVDGYTALFGLLLVGVGP